jgi:hypothetical protein
MKSNSFLLHLIHFWHDYLAYDKLVAYYVYICMHTQVHAHVHVCTHTGSSVYLARITDHFLLIPYHTELD